MGSKALGFRHTLVSNPATKGFLKGAATSHVLGPPQSKRPWGGVPRNFFPTLRGAGRGHFSLPSKSCRGAGRGSLRGHCKSCPAAGRAQVGSCPMGCWRVRARRSANLSVVLVAGTRAVPPSCPLRRRRGRACLCKSCRGAGRVHARCACELSFAALSWRSAAPQILPWCWWSGRGRMSFALPPRARALRWNDRRWSQTPQKLGFLGKVLVSFWGGLGHQSCFGFPQSKRSFCCLSVLLESSPPNSPEPGCKMLVFGCALALGW